MLDFLFKSPVQKNCYVSVTFALKDDERIIEFRLVEMLASKHCRHAMLGDVNHTLVVK